MTSASKRAALAVGIVAWFVIGVAGRTVPRGVQAGDNGEMQLVLREMGVAHPPGYPLYSLTGHLFGRVVTAPPIARFLGAGDDVLTGEVPGADAWTWAANLYSAVLAVITLILVGYAAARLAGTASAGLLAVFVLAGSATFHAQSLVANIRMPTALFAAALLCLLVCLAPTRTAWANDAQVGGANAPPWARRAAGSATRRAFALGLVVALALTHHGSLLAVALPVAVAVVAMNGLSLVRPRAIAAGALGFGAGLLPLAYLPWRDAVSSLPAPADLTTWPGFFEHVSAAGFRGDMFAFSDRAALVDRLPVMVDILGAQFLPLGLVVGLAAGGGLWLLFTRPAAGLAVAAASILTVVAGLTYRAPQTMEYLLPAYVAVAILAGSAVGIFGALGRRVGGRWSALYAPVAMLLAVLALMVLPRQPANDRHNFYVSWAAQRFSLVDGVTGSQAPAVAGTTASCIPGGSILTSWHYWAPLEYTVRHLVRREDLSVAYVFPEGDEPIGATWLRRLRETPDVVLLTDSPREVRDAGVSLWPVTGTKFFSTRPLACPLVPPAQPPPDYPANATEPEIWAFDFSAPVLVEPGIVFGDVVRLRSAIVAPKSASAGQLVVGDGRRKEMLPLAVTLNFEPIAGTDPGDLTVFAQVVGGTDHRPPTMGRPRVIAQVDRAFTAAQWAHPEGLTMSADLLPYREGLMWPFDVIVGVYRSAPGGLTRLATPLGDSVRVLRVSNTGSSSGVSLGRVPDAPEPGAVPFGYAMLLLGTNVVEERGQLVVDLTWRAEDAFDSDYHVSVQAEGAGWRAQHDGVPALGMVPTLKWLPGMVFHDRHRVPLPEGADLEQGYAVRVAVYDGFTLEPLPVTDRARVEAGEGQLATVFRHP